MPFSFSIQPLCNIFVTYSVRKVRDFMSDSPSHDFIYDNSTEIYFSLFQL